MRKADKILLYFQSTTKAACTSAVNCNNLLCLSSFHKTSMQSVDKMHYTVKNQGFFS